jgi:hypothetical protein
MKLAETGQKKPGEKGTLPGRMIYKGIFPHNAQGKASQILSHINMSGS